MKHARDLRLLGKPVRNLERALLMALHPHLKRAKPARRKPGIIGADMMAKLLRRQPKRFPLRCVRSDRSDHRIAMADNIFGTRDDREINTVRHCFEEQRRRPTIVDHRHNSARLCHSDNCGDILNLKRQASRAFHENRARAFTNQGANIATDQRVIVKRFNAKGFEQPVAENACRIIGAVSHQQLIPGPQH